MQAILRTPPQFHGPESATVASGGLEDAGYRIESIRLGTDGGPGPIRTVAAPGECARGIRVGIGGSGRPTIAWYRRDGADYRIESVHLAADGAPGALLSLAVPGHDAFDPLAAIDGSGRATIVWRRDDGANDRIESIRFAADGTREAIQTLSAAGRDATGPRVAIDGAGRATIIWSRSDGATSRVQSLRLAADGTPALVRTLSGAGRHAFGPQVALDDGGRATIAWRRFDGTSFRIQSIRLDSAGRPSAVQTLSAAGQHAYDPRMAIDDGGRATIAWRRFDGAGYRVQSIRLDTDGSPGAVLTLSAGGRHAFNPQVAIDASGRATIAWERDDGTSFRIQSVRLDADGDPGDVQTLSAAGHDAFNPRLAIDEAGGAIITWERSGGVFGSDELPADADARGAAKPR